ncbi:formylglycine-generating enzyme family protein [Leptolyngbya ohadii]|uniref:formylglycine-generating enzyme family protein n=1 Tax=Leptolyngbya ohadii TaxID=1962290 RepID=UPI0019D4C53D|nr:SUMF1/EgtB/PvdO family nonheme iron enzyme [Leptolyngbya ohadii]
MKNLIRKRRSIDHQARHLAHLAIVLPAASLIVGCGIGSPPASKVSPAPNSATASATSGKSAGASSTVLIPAGTYEIGSDTAGDAQPAHRVVLNAFRIDRYEVTNAQYAEFLNALDIQPLRDAPAGAVLASNLPEAAVPLFIEGAAGNPRQTLIALDDEHSRIAIRNGRFAAQPGYEQHPVTETTWQGAQQFCAWRGARLPTEIEWEAAARGTEGRIYPWGNEAPTPYRAVYGQDSGQTLPVGSLAAGATPDGIHDLAGNVAEWTSTLYRSYPYSSSDGREQLSSRGERVTRGGDHVYDSSPEKLTAYYRTGFSRAPDRGHRHIGFRCVQSGLPPS